MTPERPIDELELMALVDGELDEAARLGLERRLAGRLDLQCRVADYAAQRAGLRQLYGEAPLAPPGPQLRRLALLLERRLGERRLRRWVLLRRIAAAVLLLASGAGAGHYLGTGEPRPPLDNFRAEAVTAHQFYVSDNRWAVTGDDRAALDDWLSSRVGSAVYGPDLGPLGYRLLGGRPLPSAGGPRAQYLYEGAEGRRVTLFVGSLPAAASASMSYHDDGELAAAAWADGGMSYALIGAIDHESLAAMTAAIHSQVTARASSSGSEPAPPAGLIQIGGPPAATM